METTILKLAAELCGLAEADERLRLLCEAAREGWKRRLLPERREEDCAEALCCAAAFSAAADYLTSDAEAEFSFTAGEVSVRSGGAASRAAAGAELRETARRIMAPYARSGAFCFRSVRS
ncbi:MAG: hypothetical protein IKN53_06525 [Oscillibacter sp.]|nr:hypothetical protein [Oscillibacter sp.]